MNHPEEYSDTSQPSYSQEVNPSNLSSTDQPAFPLRMDLSRISNSIQQVRAEIGQYIIGQREMIDLLLIALIAKGHALIEGVPGVAKTLTAKLLSGTISAKFSRIQFTPDLMPSDLLGTSVYHANQEAFVFHPGPLFAQIILIDEINRAPAKTQAALFEVMEERQITVDGHTYPMQEPFIVLATQNPIEQEGTYRLPEAQLDRFLFKIVVHYPNEEEEFKILTDHHSRKGMSTAQQIQRILAPEDITHWQQLVESVHIEEELIRYIVKIVQYTRNYADIYLGASPRASVSILRTAKAKAILEGRDFVVPEDIQYMIAPVLRHRIMLTPEKEMEGIGVEDTVQLILSHIEIPS